MEATMAVEVLTLTVLVLVLAAEIGWLCRC
jgi:hypothetical protein